MDANSSAHRAMPSVDRQNSGLALMVLAVVVVWLLLMWVRTTTIPAPSNGDEVWSAESGYWLLHDGVMRSDWHQDEVASNIRDFFPPLPALFQAVMFKLIGVNLLALSIVPSILLTGIVLILARLLYTPERPYLALLSLAPFAFPQVYQAGLHMRYEICVAFFVTLGMLSLWSARGKGFHSPLAMYLFGFCLSAAALSYFQVGVPVLLFGLAVAALVGPSAQRWTTLARVVLGAATPLLLALWWIHPDYSLFLQACLKMGGSYKFAYGITLAWVAVAIAAAAILYVPSRDAKGYFSSDDGRVIALITLLIAALLLLQFIKFTRLALVSSILVVFAFVFLRARAQPPLDTAAHAREGVVLRALCWAFAAGAISVASATVYVGLFAQPRDYAKFTASMREAVNKTKIVVADNRAWLALREQVPAGKLIHLIVSHADPAFTHADPAYINRSMFLEGTDDSLISTLAVRPDDLEPVRSLYPLIDRFLKRSDVEGPIRIGTNVFYRLDVYRLRLAAAAPQAASGNAAEPPSRP